MSEPERGVFIAPGSSEHINKSVYVPSSGATQALLSLQGLIPIENVAETLKPEERATLEKIYSDGRIRMWGTLPGGEGTWKKLKTDDIVLFYHDNYFVCVAEVAYKTRNKSLATKVWGLNRDNEAWEFVFFLKNVKELKIYREEFAKMSGYAINFVPQGFGSVANPNIRQNILEKILGVKTGGAFQFVEADFDRCTGTKEDAEYLSERFNELLSELKLKLPSELGGFTNARVARIIGRGEKEYRDFMWLGFGHSKLEGLTQQNVQFQVSIHKDSLANFTWIDARARRARANAKTNIQNNKQAFLSAANALKGFNLDCLTLGSDEEIVKFLTGTISEPQLDEFLKAIDREDAHVDLRRDWTPAQAIALGPAVSETILTDWKDMLPAYNIMAFGSPIVEQRFSLGLYDQTFVNKVKQLLEKQLQVILFGPPGTSKTHFALSLVEDLGAQHDIVQFHSSYSYEDFVEGVTMTRDEGESAPTFKVVPKKFREICKDAVENPDAKYVLVIDEINRAPLGRVLGELILLLEYRDLEVVLPYSNEKLKLPKNLYVIGTMNSADRSIALVDYALRRRFAFVAMKPDVEILRKWMTTNSTFSEEQKDDVIALFQEINKKIKDEKELGENFQVGHTYFFARTSDELEMNWEYKIRPLIKEYYFDNEEKVRTFDELYHTLVKK